MAKAKRNIGREILEGLCEIKRGEYGRVVNVPDVAGVREKTGLSQSRFAELLGRITSYNVCYTKLLRTPLSFEGTALLNNLFASLGNRY